MATSPQPTRWDTLGRRFRPLALVCLALCLGTLVLMPGCGGCSKDPAKAKKELEKKRAEERAKRKKKKKKKPNFQPFELAVRPNDTEQRRTAYKVGHWTATSLTAKANNFDFHGDLQLVVGRPGGDPIPLPYTRFDLTTTRQADLPKGQTKLFETLLFVPPDQQQAQVSCRLNDRRSGRRAWQVTPILDRMPSYQYYFVVLARWPQSYTYLMSKFPSITPPTDTWNSFPTKAYYRVSLMPSDRRVQLPSHGLMWTSIACVLWDDREPDSLNPEQQQALLDWLHWGGQLIVSGPETLDTLADSFLTPYLPATAGGTRELAADAFQPLHRWASGNKTVPPLVPDRPLAGVELKLHAKARLLPGSGGLIAERRVGRGRIVVTAFGLSNRAVTNWPGFDELFNAFLLRHPKRKFSKNSESELQVNWADSSLSRLDAGYISNLRYFTRDAGVQFKEQVRVQGKTIQVGYGRDIRRDSLESSVAPPPAPGVAAWNDYNPLANAAREALNQAARIKIPGRNFVIWTLAGYLLILVPLNWLAFRLIGRVEWAWAAAPLIAVACTIVVIRLAQLDIGFAKARTEIAVVELQGDYSRAHVTRYNALYTSLTTHYNLEFDDPGSLVHAFPSIDRERFEMQEQRNLLCSRGMETDLQGYFVQSASIGMVHSEQMVDLGGGLSLVENEDGGRQVVNGTELTLEDAGVLCRDESGKFKTAWIGTLEPGATAPLYLREPTTNPGPQRWWADKRKGSPLLDSRAAEGALNLRGLLDQVQAVENVPHSQRELRSGQRKLPRGDIRRLQPGQARLVGIVRAELPGPKISPAGIQPRTIALVVAHLDHGHGEDPQPDVNTKEKPRS